MSTKSVLEPVPEIQWLGKWLVFSGMVWGFSQKGFWIWAAVVAYSF